LRLSELRSSFDDALIARCRIDGVRAAAPSPPSVAAPAVGVTAAEDMQDPRRCCLAAAAAAAATDGPGAPAASTGLGDPSTHPSINAEINQPRKYFSSFFLHTAGDPPD